MATTRATRMARLPSTSPYLGDMGARDKQACLCLQDRPGRAIPRRRQHKQPEEGNATPPTACNNGCGALQDTTNAETHRTVMEAWPNTICVPPRRCQALGCAFRRLVVSTHVRPPIQKVPPTPPTQFAFRPRRSDLLSLALSLCLAHYKATRPSNYPLSVPRNHLRCFVSG